MHFYKETKIANAKNITGKYHGSSIEKRDTSTPAARWEKRTGTGQAGAATATVTVTVRLARRADTDAAPEISLACVFVC